MSINLKDILESVLADPFIRDSEAVKVNQILEWVESELLKI